MDMPATELAATETTQPEHKITRTAVGSWVLYDLANTIFSMGVTSLFFSLWVRDEVGANRADWVYSLISTVSMAIIFVASPMLGAMTDRAPRRMPFLVVSTIVCVVFTALFDRAGFILTSIFFVIANIAYQAGLQYYDALLPEVSTEENRGWISGLGVGFGYLGSYLAVGYGLYFSDRPKSFLFLLIAISFLLLAIPCFFFVKERGNPNPSPITLEMLKASVAETIRTLRSSNEFPGLARFLFGRIFYTDAINTVIRIMGLFTVNVAVNSGLDEANGQKKAQLILMSAITFAVFGGFFWGWVTDKYGPKRTLNYVLRSWIGIFLAAASVGLFGLPLIVLYVVAAAAGIGLGGIWAADRPLMLRLTPPTRIGEFYGLYGMVGRFSAISGPIIWGTVTWLSISVFKMKPLIGQGIGVLVLTLLMVTSYVILKPLSDERRVWDKEGKLVVEPVS